MKINHRIFSSTIRYLYKRQFPSKSKRYLSLRDNALSSLTAFLMKAGLVSEGNREEVTNGTTDVINKYRDKISYFTSEPDDGIFDAMNKGIKADTGEWTNFMNAGDCLYNSEVLQNVVNQGMNADMLL